LSRRKASEARRDLCLGPDEQERAVEHLVRRHGLQSIGNEASGGGPTIAGDQHKVYDGVELELLGSVAGGIAHA